MAQRDFKIFTQGRPERPRIKSLLTRLRDAVLDLAGIDTLERSAVRFRQLADAMPQIVWTARPDGMIDYGNRLTFEFLGLTEEDLLRQDWTATVHPDDLGRVLAGWADSVRTETTFEIQYRLRRVADHTYRWHQVRCLPIRNASGRVVKWYGTATDVHDSKQAADELERLARQLSITLDSIGEAFLNLDADWRITYVNHEAERQLGRRRQDLVGKVMWDEYPMLVGTDTERAYRRAVEEKRVADLEYHSPTLNRWFKVRAYPSAAGLTIYFRDSTEKWHMRRFKAEQTGVLERISAGAPLGEILPAAIRIVESAEYARACVLMLPGASRTRLAAAAHSSAAAELAHAAGTLDMRAFLGADLQASARPLVVDLRGDALWTAAQPVCERMGIRACWSYPIRTRNGAIAGALAVFTAVPRDPAPYETEMLAACAHTIAIALERQATDKRSREHEALLRLRQRAIEASASPIVIRSALPPEFPVEYANPAFERVTGFTLNEVLGKSLDVLCRDELDQAAFVNLQASRLQGREGHGVLRSRHRDGSLLWLESYSTPVRGEDGVVTHFLTTMHDITAARNYLGELEYRSNYDLLTGLANRNLLRDRASHAIARAERNGGCVWFVCINLVRFRLLNETLGHEAGDTVLRTTAARIREAVGGVDTVARWEGDEFVVVLPDARDEHAVTAVTRRVREAISQPLDVNGQEYFISCSAGLSVFPADGQDAARLIQQAHIAMQQARDAGSGSLQFYTESMNARAMDRLRIEAELRHAIERDELFLHYQPKACLRTGRVVGMEALLRWQHPLLGIVPPDRIVRVAEEAGMMVGIGTWVLETACHATKRWQDLGRGDLRMSVNVAAGQFYETGLAGTVAAALAASGLDPRYLELELTEGIVMTDVEHALGIMRELKALGVTLSLDDFGTGYSSLAYLQRFPIDVLKIDKSFVNNITHDVGEAAIARSVINLAQALQLRVVAEGVETEEQYLYLRRHRCDEVQGYFISRPLPQPGFEQFLAQERPLPGTQEEEGDGQTLLIVDDEPNTLAALNRLLRRDGYRILRAASADEALGLLARHEVQVVLSDHRMPGTTGAEFLGKVKEMYPSVIRMMMSGYASVDSVIAATNSGAVFRFHTKPWDDNVLRSSIAEAFRYHWLVHREIGAATVVTGHRP